MLLINIKITLLDNDTRYSFSFSFLLYLSTWLTHYNKNNNLFFSYLHRRKMNHVLILCIIFLPIIIESRSISVSHVNPSDVKRFESKLDTEIGYWSPSTSSIDWCERNYVVTYYIAEFWNCISSFAMCLLAILLTIRGLYNGIEKRFLLLIFSFGIVGLGSAYFHGTLTYLGQMADELPMVYSMIVWWFILFRMNKSTLTSTISPIDILVLFGVFYGFLWTYIHSLKTFVVIFQLHFTLMILGGLIRLIQIYKQIHCRTHYIFYLLVAYFSTLILATICWLCDQKFCEQLNQNENMNPQLHAWWHLLMTVNFHMSVVCVEAMRLLSIQYEQQPTQNFKPENHLRIVFHYGLPFVDYSKQKHQKEKKIN